MSDPKQQYARLLIATGVNLQPGQSLIVRAELGHAEFVRLAVAEAYKAGAAYVQVDWQDAPTLRALLKNADVEHLELPAYEVTRHRQMVDERWARLALVGPEFPFVLDDVDPAASRTLAVKRSRLLKFYSEAVMANQMQWCVAAVPTPAWAQRIFPELPAAAAVERLWSTILQLVRADQPDPVAAWGMLNRQLKSVAAFMQEHQVRAVHFFDPAPGPDGKPATDLTIGLTDYPNWVGGASVTPAGVVFQPNMPTEEIFCTPHNERTHGYVRTSRPSYPMQREVDDAYFRFEQGEVVEFSARSARRCWSSSSPSTAQNDLGEVALVDTRSPVFQSGLLFYEILFDENAACHIAFGEAYPECVAGSKELNRDQLKALGVNFADTHLDFMIGTPTMRVTGHCADGSEVVLMTDGRFVDAVVGDVA